MTLETIALEAGERGEIVVYPETDVSDPRVVLEGTDDTFAVEDVLLGRLPAPSVEVSDAPRGTWAARVQGVLAGPEQPLKILVRNTGDGKVTLRASLDDGEVTLRASLDEENR